MSFDEFLLWLGDYSLEPWDKTTDAILSNGFAATLQSWGSKIAPRDLIPRWDDGGPEAVARREKIEQQLFHARMVAHNRRAAKKQRRRD